MMWSKKLTSAVMESDFLYKLMWVDGLTNVSDNFVIDQPFKEF